jgi:hypothetical protein
VPDVPEYDPQGAEEVRNCGICTGELDRLISSVLNSPHKHYGKKWICH